MNKMYTKPAVEITALNAEDIIMASTLLKTTVGEKTAENYGSKSFAEAFNEILGGE